jgi:general secretion pathway protein E
MQIAASLSVDAFLNFLAENQVVGAEGVQRVRGAIRATGQPLDVIMTELGVLRDRDLAEQLSKFLDVPRAAEIEDEFAAPLAAELGIGFAHDFGVLPIAKDGGCLTLGSCNPFDRSTMAAVSHFFDCDIALVSMTRSEISASCTRLRAIAEADAAMAGQPLAPDEFLEDDAEKLQDIALSAPVVSLVTRITQRAFDENATDIHVEPLEDRVQIRIRKDGMLVPLETAGKALSAGITSRIKILSRLNIVERRLPQDGRMRLSIRGQEVDFRVSVVPSAHGETIALRLLHNRGMSLELSQLGYDEAARHQLERLSQNANGIMIITGPTGSGKTTTLYSLISMLNVPERKIFTVEDPVEYRIDGITQLQVNPGLGLDFARALRSILRQDPDIILVGEIRDRETAQIAIQAALTGHLVLTTLHTNSAAGALTRLIDMGIEPYLIGATVRGIVGQRLVRKLCDDCRGEARAHCKACGGSGYRGRSVAYEILEVTHEIASLLSQGENEALIERRACEAGMLPLAECGNQLVAAGMTSEAEVARVIGLGAAR